MNNVPKEDMDKILNALSEKFGADNVVLIYGGPKDGLKMAMRKDELIEPEAMRSNLVEMVNGAFNRIRQIKNQ